MIFLIYRRTAAALEVTSWSSLWFAFSVSLVVYNKWLLHYWRGTGFAFPITISAFHMSLKLCLSWVYFRCSMGSEEALPSLGWRQYVKYAVPVGAFTGFDVGASNAAFMFVTVSFYTTVKSSSLVFTLAFSVLYGIEPCQLSLWLVTLLICGGVVMVSASCLTRSLAHTTLAQTAVLTPRVAQTTRRCTGEPRGARVRCDGLCARGGGQLDGRNALGADPASDARG